VEKKKRDTITPASPNVAPLFSPKSAAPGRVFGAALDVVMAREKERDPNATVPRIVKEGFDENFFCLFWFHQFTLVEIRN
jgi:hypothetical protein